MNLETWGEVAARFKVSERTVKYWAALHGLPYRKRGSGGHGVRVICDVEELDRWYLRFVRQPRRRVA